MVAALVPDRYQQAFERPRSFAAAVSREWLIPFTERMYPTYRPAPHHHLIANHLEAVERGDIRRLVITMPPRHGKSTLASEHFPAWFLGRNPDKRIIACSYAATLAYMFSRRARNLLVAPLWPFDVRPASDLAQAQSWDVDGHRGGYIAAGVGGGITGVGANLLIIDDPVKSAADADSETVRESTWEWYRSTAYTRLEPDGAVVIIGTRWHDEDLIGRALASPDAGWVHLDLPAINDDDEALWPDRFDVFALKRIKADIGSRAWEALYQQRPSPAEGGTFHRDWWQSYRLPPVLTRVETFVDSAFKEGVANDYSVFATWGTDGLGNYYVLDVWRERVEFPSLIQAGRDQVAKQRARFSRTVPLVVEDKASGQSAIQVWSKPQPGVAGMLPAVGAIAFKGPAGWSAASKESRAEGISPLVEARRVFLPEDAPWRGDFVEEHARFPAGRHDDMCLVAGTAVATRWGDVPIERIQPGAMVLTPIGFRRVNAAGRTGVRPVVERNGLVGTPNHPVFVHGAGFFPMDSISVDLPWDILSLGGLLRWMFLSLSSSKASSIGSWGRDDITLASQRRTRDGNDPRDCMSLSGSRATGDGFLPAGRFIIRIATRSITILATWSAYRLGCIVRSLGHYETPSASADTSTVSARRRPNGTVRMKGGAGIRRILVGLGGCAKLGIRTAPSAVGRFLPIAAMHAIALPFAAIAPALGKHGRWSSKPALSAVPRSSRPSPPMPTGSLGRAAGPAGEGCAPSRPVYNLTVEGAGCYYANGILVSNCDTTSMALTRLAHGPAPTMAWSV